MVRHHQQIRVPTFDREPHHGVLAPPGLPLHPRRLPANFSRYRDLRIIHGGVSEAQDGARASVHEGLIEVLDEHDLCVDAEVELLGRHKVAEILGALNGIRVATVFRFVGFLFCLEAHHTVAVRAVDLFAAREASMQ